MFSANTELQVTDTQFNSIKENIKTFIKNKTQFADYDFEGSTINYLMDILAYNTYLNSFYTNMAINETFLDTAQLRSNVVSNAKELGYVPRSSMSAVAEVILTFTPNDAPGQIKIPKKTKFTATKNGVTYNFVTLQDYLITPTNGIYTKLIQIYEGEFIQQTYTFSDTKIYYEILDKDVDITTLTVGIKPNSTSSDITYYNKVNTIVDVSGTSQVYYLQENTDEKFEIYFGDDVLGKSLTNGNVINLEYVSNNGSAANDIAVFKVVGTSGENATNSTIKYAAKLVTSSKSTNGQDKEGIGSIQFNAPNFYASQNRLVTTEDYENFIYSNYPYIESVNVWGGESNDPPIYGRVILSLKPFGAFALQQANKDAILSDMKKKNVLSIEPFMVDPIFTFIKPSIVVTYDSSKTIKTVEEIYDAVASQVQAFENDNLSVFGKSFRYSIFIKTIDAADSSILGNDTEIQLEKRFLPQFNSTATYKLRYAAAIKHPYDGYLGSVTSTGFNTNTTDETLFVEDDGFGKIRTYYFDSSNTKKIYKSNVGTVDYGIGTIQLNAFYFTDLEDSDASEFKVFVTPQERNYTQDKNQILLLSGPILQIKNSKTNSIITSGIVEVNGDISPIQHASTLSSTITV
jgi:hypothetical protein